MPYEVAPSQLAALRKAFAEKNRRQTILQDTDISELVNASYQKTGDFAEEFAMVVEAMPAKEQRYLDRRL